MAKKTEEKITVRRFKDGRDSWWVAGKHWTILEGRPYLAAGGMFVQEEYDHFIAYLKRNKIPYNE